MHDVDDVFESDLSLAESEKIIAENDYIKQTDKIGRLSYSEGFFATCDKEIREKYDEAFDQGKLYSLNFGRILGRLDAFINLREEMKLIKVIDQSDLEELSLIRKEAESYQKELSEEIIAMLNARIDPIVKKYI